MDESSVPKRYKRNSYIVYPAEHQEKIKEAGIVFGGIGLGSVIAETALRLGFENFVFIDGDTVSETNLNRQNYTYFDAQANLTKSQALINRLQSIHPTLTVEARVDAVKRVEIIRQEFVEVVKDLSKILLEYGVRNPLRHLMTDMGEALSTHLHVVTSKGEQTVQRIELVQKQNLLEYSIAIIELKEHLLGHVEELNKSEKNASNNSASNELGSLIKKIEEENNEIIKKATALDLAEEVIKEAEELKKKIEKKEKTSTKSITSSDHNIITYNQFLTKDNIYNILEEALDGCKVAVNALDFDYSDPTDANSSTFQASFVFDQICQNKGIPVIHPLNMSWIAGAFVISKNGKRMDEVVKEESGVHYETSISSYFFEKLKNKDGLNLDWLGDAIDRRNTEFRYQNPAQIAVGASMVSGLTVSLIYDLIIGEYKVSDFPDHLYTLSGKGEGSN